MGTAIPCRESDLERLANRPGNRETETRDRTTRGRMLPPKGLPTDRSRTCVFEEESERKEQTYNKTRLLHSALANNNSLHKVITPLATSHTPFSTSIFGLSANLPQAPTLWHQSKGARSLRPSLTHQLEGEYSYCVSYCIAPMRLEGMRTGKKNDRNGRSASPPLTLHASPRKEGHLWPHCFPSVALSAQHKRGWSCGCCCWPARKRKTPKTTSHGGTDIKE